MEVVFKFKKEIFGLIFAGVVILIVVYVLAPDRSEQIFNTLTFLAVILMMVPFLFIMLQYIMNKR